MKNVLFAWDFHGVLEQDNEYALQETINNVMGEFHISKTASLQEIRSLYGISISDFYRSLVHSLSDEMVSRMVERLVETSRESIRKYIRPRDHAHYVLDQIKERGSESIVISNCNQADIEFFLGSVDMRQCVSAYFGINSDNGTGSPVERKAAAIKEYAARGFRKIVMVGDSDTDIKAGQECGATTYFFQPEHEFENPDLDKTVEANHYISDLREVLKELKF